MTTMLVAFEIGFLAGMLRLCNVKKVYIYLHIANVNKCNCLQVNLFKNN